MAGTGAGERFRQPSRLSARQQQLQQQQYEAALASAVPVAPVSVPAGQPLSEVVNSALVEFEEKTLPTLPEELQKAYQSGGIEAYTKAFDKYNQKLMREPIEPEGEQQAQITGAESFTPSPEVQARLAELQNTLTFADKVRSGAVQLEPEEERAFWDSVADIQAEQDLLQQAVEQEGERTAITAGIPEAEVVTELPEGKQETTAHGLIEVIADDGSSSFYKQVDGGYVQTGPTGIPWTVLESPAAIATYSKLEGKEQREAAIKSGIATQADFDRYDAYKLLQDKYGGNPMLAIESGDIDAVRKLYPGEQVLDLQLAVSGKHDWETDVLPTMSQEFQDAYRAGDTAKLAQLQSQYSLSQQEFERWISTEAPDILRKAYRTGGISAYNVAVAQLEKTRSDALGKLESSGYRLTYEQLGKPVMTTVGDTTKHYTDQYNIVGYLRDAVNKDLSTPTIRQRTQPKQVWNVDRGVWEDTGIIQTKSVEQQLSEYGVNYKAAIATLRDAGFSDDSISKAILSATTKPGVTIGPSTAERPLGIQIAASKAEFGLEKWLNEKNTEFMEKLSTQGSVAGAIAGTGSALLTMAVAMPMLIAKVGSDPSKAPEVAISAVKDMATQVASTVRTYAASAKTGFLMSPYDLAYNTTTTALIMAPVVGAAKGIIGKATVYISPRGLTPGMIAKELSTGRLKLGEGLDQAMTDALTEALRQSMRKDTPFTGEVPIRGTTLKFRYLKSPVNEAVGGIRWHGAKDALNFVRDQLEVTVIDGKKTVKVKIPAGAELTKAVMKLKTYSNEAIAALDTPQVRPLRFTDAVDVPKELARVIQDYVKANNGTVYGSFVDWIKSKKAVRPNDIDVVVETARQAESARQFVSGEARKLGYETRANDRGVQIRKDGTWTTVANIVSRSQHEQMVRSGGYKGYTVLSDEGIITETAGTQLVNQALGSTIPSPKSGVRARKVIQSAPQIVRIAETKGVAPSVVSGMSGTFVAGESGLYTDPWAAFQYTRGDNPGLLMIIDDVSNVKTARVAKLSESADFIAKAKEDTFGPSKIYKGDLETEIVDAPGKRFAVPDPKADLITRTLVGTFADFFTYDNGRFVPVKLAISESLLKSGNVRIPTIKELYKAKLLTTINALRDTEQALKHPVAIGQDAIRSIKALRDVDPLYGSGRGGSTTIWGVRDVYLQTDWGLKMKSMIDRLFKRAEEKTDAKARSMGVKRSSKAYQDMLRENMKDAYDASARSMISNFRNVASAYSASAGTREVFETAYATRLGQTVEEMFRGQSIQGASLESALRDVESYAGVSSAISSREAVSPLDSSRLTLERSISPLSRSGTVASEREVAESGRPVVSEIRSATEERRPTTEERMPAEERRPVTEERRPSRDERRPVEERRPPYERITPYERLPTEEREPPREPPPPTGISRLITSSPTAQPIPAGSIAWAQGSRKGIRGMLVPQWYYIPPPYNQTKPISMSAPPIGARLTGSVKPSETIQIIGKSRLGVPKRVAVDLGWADIVVLNGRTIDFTGGGLGTNVGTRIASPTVGMSVEDGGDYVESELYSGKVATGKGKGRGKTGKKKPARKSRRIDAIESVTSLKGLRL